MIEEVSNGEVEKNEAAPTITQTPYFSPAFNAAIFDGPIRIYFAQYQEEEALKIYFRVQEYVSETHPGLKEELKDLDKNVFIMFYPNADLFARSFSEDECNEEKLGYAQLDNDLVIGVNGAKPGIDYDAIFETISGAGKISN